MTEIYTEAYPWNGQRGRRKMYQKKNNRRGVNWKVHINKQECYGNEISENPFLAWRPGSHCVNMRIHDSSAEDHTVC